MRWSAGKLVSSTLFDLGIETLHTPCLQIAAGSIFLFNVGANCKPTRFLKNVVDNISQGLGASFTLVQRLLDF